MRPRPEDHLSDHLPHRSVLHRHGCLRHRHCLTGCPGTSTRSSAHCVRGAPFSARRFPRFRSGRIHGCRRATRRRSAPGALRSFPVARLRGGQSSSPPPFPAGHGQRRRESREVPHPYQRPILRTPASASLQSGRAQSRFAPAHPAARFSCAVPPQERPGPQASVRSTRPLRPDPPEKKSPAPFRNGRGRVSVCVVSLSLGLAGGLFFHVMWWPLKCREWPVPEPWRQPAAWRRRCRCHSHLIEGPHHILRGQVAGCAGGEGAAAQAAQSGLAPW